MGKASGLNVFERCTPILRSFFLPKKERKKNSGREREKEEEGALLSALVFYLTIPKSTIGGRNATEPAWRQKTWS